MKKKKSSPLHIKESGWTVDDYYQLPEDGHQYEIIGGVLEMKPSPSTTHQRVSHQMERVMSDSCESDYIILDAPIDVILSENETRQLDLLLIHKSREHIIEEHAIVGPPNLVVEIISPSSAKLDRTTKLESYARFGVATGKMKPTEKSSILLAFQQIQKEIERGRIGFKRKYVRC